MLYPIAYVDFEKIGLNPYEEPIPGNDPNYVCYGTFYECSVNELLSPYREYFSIFPDDKPIAVGYHIGGSVSAADKINAYQWAVENQCHWWEYPDLHPELIPGYWERILKEHPDWVF